VLESSSKLATTSLSISSRHESKLNLNLEVYLLDRSIVLHVNHTLHSYHDKLMQRGIDPGLLLDVPFMSRQKAM
jgi:hypothetical protein